MVRSVFFYDDVMSVAENMNTVLASVDNAVREAGRPEGSVRLVAVSKTRPREDVQAALAAGQLCFGENRVTEALDKFEGLVPPAELHLIGHLQGNKARLAAGRFALIHSVDSLKLADRLVSLCRETGSVQPVLIQLNTSGEESKSGYESLDDVLRDLERILACPELPVRGLMTMGPLAGSDSDVARAFALCRESLERIRGRFGDAVGTELSMGMSSDYRIAIREGSTLVRVGTAIFGERSVPA